MKKLMNVLLLMFISAILYGQAEMNSPKVMFKGEPMYLTAFKNMAESARNKWDYHKYLDAATYHFYANNILYVLSYEDCDDCDRYLTYNKSRGDSIGRKVYLYALDETTMTWKIASDVIKIDYNKCNSEGKRAHSYHYHCIHDFSDMMHTTDGITKGSIKIMSNGNVEFIIIYFTKDYNDNGDKLKWFKVTLVPNNNYYTVKK